MCELTAARGLPQTLHALEAVAHRHSLFLSTLLMQGEVGHENGHWSPGVGEREKKECVMCMERLRQVRLRCGHAGISSSFQISLSCLPPHTHIPLHALARAFAIYAFAIRLLERGRAAVSHASQMKSTKADDHTSQILIICDIRPSPLLHAHTSQIHIFCDIRPSPLLISQCCAVSATNKFSAQCLLSALSVGDGATQMQRKMTRWHGKQPLCSAMVPSLQC